MICDDIIAEQKFLKSPAMIRLAAMGRHYLVSTFVSTQSYTKIPRPVRLQARSLILFPSSQDEVELVVNDHCPPHVSKKDFRQLVEYATRDKHDFLYINADAEPSKRFRKRFSEYLVPNVYREGHNSNVVRKSKRSRRV